MTEKKEDDSSVRVALRIRPQLAREKIDMCQVCTQVSDTDKQVTLGRDKAFTFDYVYDIASTQDYIYGGCVRKLIDGNKKDATDLWSEYTKLSVPLNHDRQCFDGYNATVFAYGQTGSGKTYTMGTGFDVNIPESEIGIVPRAVDHLFRGIEQRKREALEKNEPLPDFKVNAQFMELYNEEILDLLDTTRDPETRGRKSHIKVHEDAEGGIYVVGVTTKPVTSLQDTIQCLQVGALSRSTASTNMNASSSRSHAIFTLHIKQHRLVREDAQTENQEDNDGEPAIPAETINEFETLTAKFHFVDLAGSERLKRTGATGDRAKEGISINCGLLALGNVISALGDKLKKGSHVPYRDSKLTRLLQDSLGGNSRTLMIACISPSDRDFMETLNTLKYANRARNIKNKVIANQDKASKQLAILRSEIAVLQMELLEYKSGKRMVDSEGVETTNDMFHENTMLQSENDKLRQRIKTLNDTVDKLTARNTELLADKAVLSLGNAAGDANSEEVVTMITGYVKELEELRTKLAESEMECDNMKRLRPVSSRSMLSPISTSRSFDGTLSPDNSITTILEEAKKDVKRMKRMKRSSSRTSQLSDKENIPQDDNKEQEENGENGENGEIEEKDASEKTEKDSVEDVETMEEELNGDDEEDELDDDDDDNSDSSSDSDSEGKDSDNIHEDLAELTCDITIKQRLIEELEHSQRRLHSMKVQYDEKVQQLVVKIKETEMERDKVLSSMNHVESQTVEKSKKIKEQFERKLNDMQNELKKLNAAKKEHAKLVRNQSHYEKQLKTLQHELAEMKKTKVRLMKQIKEDSDKNKQSELRRNKEIAQMRKEQMKKEGLIRNLEKEKKQRDAILRRKQEEVEVLRKRNRPMSNKAAGRVARYDRPSTIAMEESKPLKTAPISSSSPRRRRRGAEFSAKAAKHKWDMLEKNVNAVVNKRQTITNIEKDMDIWLKHREKLGKKLEKYIKKRESAVQEGKSEEEVKEMNDVIESLNNQVEFAQDNISECQTNIVQVEEAKEEMEALDPAALVGSVNLEEARYLLEHFVNMAVSKGLALAAKESEARELNAKLHQTELNNTLQQDLLKHMMVDRVDIEVDNLMTNQVDEMESSTSSSSSSPVDSMFESRAEIPASPKPALNCLSSLEPTSKKDKARRRTTTPDDLLYAGNEEVVAMLNPVPETPDETPGNVFAELGAPTMMPPVMSLSAPAPTVNGNGTDNSLMPPPKMPPMKQPSSTRLPTVSPSLRRKEYPKPSPQPSPVLRRKNSFTLQPRPSSVETVTSSDTTPPSSPLPSRRSERITDSNVFSRLTSNTAGIADINAKRGSIVTASARINTNKTAPLVCTHTAEGHTKAVLSVSASEDLLLTSSKDRTAKVWDLQTGKEVMSFVGHPNNVTAVRYCPSERLVFTVSQSYINVWDIRERSNKCIKSLSSSGLTQDGLVNFTVGSRQIDLPSGEHHISDIEVNANGSLLYSAGGNVVRVWDIRRFAAIGKLSGGHQAAIMVMAVDQKEKSDTVITGSKDHYIKIFEVLSGGAGVLTPKYNLEPPHYDGIQSLAIQGNTLFSGSRDTCIKKWDLSCQTLVHSINAAHKDWICSLAFMPGTNTLLSGCRGGYLKLWHPDTCATIAEVKAHTSPINAIATNSSTVFTASNDHTVRVWRSRNLSDPSDSSDLQDDKCSTSS